MKVFKWVFPWGVIAIWVGMMVVPRFLPDSVASPPPDTEIPEGETGFATVVESPAPEVASDPDDWCVGVVADYIDCESFQSATYWDHVSAFDVEVEIADNGKTTFTETWVQEFFTSGHGMLRDVLVRQRYDDAYDRVYPFELVGVTASEGTPSDASVEHSGNYETVRIGDEDVWITGTHTYTITYTLEGTLNEQRDSETGDEWVEFYWNILGEENALDMRDITVRVETPGDVSRVACFAGPRFSTASCSTAATDAGAAVFTQDELDAGNPLTVVVAIPPDAVSVDGPILDERWSLQSAFRRTPATLGVSTAILAAIMGTFGLLLWAKGRDRQALGSPVDVAFADNAVETERVPLFGDKTTPVEFAPPDNIRPGELGTLLDEVANPLDVSATIVDLAVRGHLRIETVDENKRGKAEDYRFVKLQGTDRLLPYEHLLYDKLFGSRDTVLLSQKKDKFFKSLAKVQDAMYDHVVEQGWFTKRPDRTRARWLAIGVGTLVGGLGAAVALAWFTHWALVGVALVLGGLIFLIGSRWMPRRTAKGTGVLKRVKGFREFIEHSEAYRARWAEQRNIFSEYLPYAIVFDATEKWAKAFEEMYGEPPDTSQWYVGSHAFTALTFSRSLASFSSSAGRSLTSTPGGSGGSGFSGGGGGGFSGGGGGGGGGGRW